MFDVQEFFIQYITHPVRSHRAGFFMEQTQRDFDRPVIKP